MLDGIDARFARQVDHQTASAWLKLATAGVARDVVEGALQLVCGNGGMTEELDALEREHAVEIDDICAGTELAVQMKRGTGTEEGHAALLALAASLLARALPIKRMELGLRQRYAGLLDTSSYGSLLASIQTAGRLKTIELTALLLDRARGFWRDSYRRKPKESAQEHFGRVHASVRGLLSKQRRSRSCEPAPVDAS
jgi:hypothetical protein